MCHDDGFLTLREGLAVSQGIDGLTPLADK